MKDFDLRRVAVSLLPAILRKPVVSAILRAALSPVQASRDKMGDSHNGTPYGTLYRLGHTGQTASLESLLNDRFDPESRSITVGESGGGERWWLYAENDITLMPSLRTWLGAEGGGRSLLPDSGYSDRSEAGFVVSVPSHLKSFEASLRASIDDFRAAGTAYSIAYF